ncbi:LysM peptidoglycan-binding domain-containing protein [Numidum massiliense]|uniref:LysM peptidoglycan-binding domain-containing protein n=1 Tax=Numidum massiliense TaxID=1522315 RepID=UPI0006D535BC|nr:LysM domain-containing protein [Numidum massiliense]
MRIHIVRQGDTLWKLSKQYNVSLQTIIDDNRHIQDPNNLQAGTKIRIATEGVPIKPRRQAAAPAETQPAAGKKVASPSPIERKRIDVLPGETRRPASERTSQPTERTSQPTPVEPQPVGALPLDHMSSSVGKQGADSSAASSTFGSSSSDLSPLGIGGWFEQPWVSMTGAMYGLPGQQPWGPFDPHVSAMAPISPPSPLAMPMRQLGMPVAPYAAPYAIAPPVPRVPPVPPVPPVELSAIPHLGVPMESPDAHLSMGMPAMPYMRAPCPCMTAMPYDGYGSGGYAPHGYQEMIDWWDGSSSSSSSSF